MIGIMRDGLGVGLAATQLGILRRLLVFQAGRDPEPTALVNPNIEWLSDDIAVAEEGCLSLPGVAMDVERSLHARLSGLDVDGEPVTLEASGLEARVLQHEIDHLDGVLILDRAPRDQRKARAAGAARRRHLQPLERGRGRGGLREHAIASPERTREDRLPRDLRVRGGRAAGPRREPSPAAAGRHPTGPAARPRPADRRRRRRRWRRPSSGSSSSRPRT